MNVHSVITMTERANDAARKGDAGAEVKWLNAALYTLRSYLAGDPNTDPQLDSPAPQRPTPEPVLLHLRTSLEDRRVLAYRKLRGTVPTALPEDYDEDDGECAIFDDDGTLLGTEITIAGVVTCYDTNGNAL